MDTNIKADVGQEVYYLCLSTIRKGKITLITRCEGGGGKMVNTYTIGGCKYYDKEVGLTIDDILDELRKTAEK